MDWSVLSFAMIQTKLMICVSVIWSDVGNDLAESGLGPWRDDAFSSESWNVKYLPTIQHAKRIAFKTRIVQESQREHSKSNVHA